MERFISSLPGSEGGRRFLLNLYWALDDGLDVALARRLIQRAFSLKPAPAVADNFFPQLQQLQEAVFAAPEDYQFQGLAPPPVNGRWMTVKTASQLAVLLEQGVADHLDRFPKFDRSSALDLEDVDYADVADIINDEAAPVAFALSRQFPRRTPDEHGNLRRQGPVWFSRWCAFEHATAGLPAREAAGRLRDWLGLPADDEPMFAFHTRDCIDASKLASHRPTVFDGLDGPLFKYPTGGGFRWLGCGSAADVLLLVPGDASAEIDGGPELVGSGIRFNQSLFECVYVGRATALAYDPHESPFWKFLLPNGVDLGRIVDGLARALKDGRLAALDGVPARGELECCQQSRCSACVAFEN